VVESRTGTFWSEKRATASTYRHAARQAVDEIAAQLPVRPGDQDPHY
jgi:hypothetical protein